MQENFISRNAWLFFGLLGGLLILSGFFILSAGVDPNDFESATGVAWSEFAADQPTIATYIFRLERLIGVALIAMALFVIALALQAFRRKELWAYYTMWLLPLSFAGYTLVFFTHNAAGLGYFYFVAALFCGLLLIFSRRAMK